MGAGAKSAKELAKQGFWINGTADSLGTEDLKNLKSSLALQMIHPHLKDDWNVLTHHQATSDLGVVIGCYERVEKNVSTEYENKLKTVAACYWSSYPQYQAFMRKFSFLVSTQHFCGLGKTWQEFKQHQAEVKIHPVASMEDFYGLRK